VLTTGSALVSDLGDAIARDPEVRQARMIADVARTRLLACMTGAQEGIDLMEAQGMLDTLRNAQVLAEDAEDRVLVHRGLLTSAEADQRAGRRRPAVTRADWAARGVRAGRFARRLRLPVALPRPGGRMGTAAVIASVLALGAIGAVLAYWTGIRLPLARR
jgi:hypothetical protein